MCIKTEKKTISKLSYYMLMLFSGQDGKSAANTDGVVKRFVLAADDYTVMRPYISE